jgi:hypothetical protein
MKDTKHSWKDSSYIWKTPKEGRPLLKSQDDTTPQELTRDHPCCNRMRFIDRNQRAGFNLYPTQG